MKGWRGVGTSKMFTHSIQRHPLAALVGSVDTVAEIEQNDSGIQAYFDKSGNGAMQKGETSPS